MANPLLRFAIALQGYFSRQRFEQAASNPRKAQEQFLNTLLTTNADTVFGRAHGFSEIKSPADFRARVPVQDYEGVRPYVEQLINREKAVLTAEEPFMFASTSGTTSDPKLIPVNDTWKRSFTNLTRLWLANAQRDHPGLLQHQILTIMSAAIEDHTRTGQPIGSVSGVTRAKMSGFVKKLYSLPNEVAEISDYDMRYRVIMRIAMERQISLIVTPNPSTLVRMADTANRDAELIFRAIHDGNAGYSPQDAEQRAYIDAIEARLTPNPRRAKALEQAAEQAGHLYPAQAWPDLKLIGCWLGGSAGIQARQLAQFYGEGVPLRDIGYRATEGTMTLPVTNDTPAGPLACASNFYEFIPVDNIDDDDPPVLLADEIKEGERYYILITNQAGLYRYDINDVIEVQGFWRNAPLVAFIQKGRDMVSITGEKLHVNQILEATRRATESSGVDWTQIQVVPDVEAARYDFLLEPTTGDVPQEGLERFVQDFDTQLGECNMEYRGKRKSKRLRLPRLYVMRPGWSERIWRADVISAGKRDAQYKWPFIRLEWDERNREDVVQSIDLDGGEGLLQDDA